MKRQNKDGRPIRSDKVWKRILWIGDNLEKIGYRESKKSPNLFYKQINGDNGRGVMFADLRGTFMIPIWEDASPITYNMDISFKRYIKEVILLNRNKCFPRTTFDQDSELEGWAIDIGIPEGYCEGCGKDIIHDVDWSLLEDGIFNEEIDKNELKWLVEVCLCQDCKIQEEVVRGFLKKESQLRSFGYLKE